MVKRLIKTLLSPGRIGLGNEQARSAWVTDKLKHIPLNSRLLDAGAGEQPYRPVCGHLDYVSQDIGNYDGHGEIGLQTNNWEFGKTDIVSDIINIPEPDQSFDAILCTEVIEHISEPTGIFPEFARLLKSRGELILTAPFCSLTHFAPEFYHTGFSRFFYEYQLAENGFELLEISYNGNYFEYLAQELLRLNSVALSYSKTGLSAFDKLFINRILHKIKKLSDEDQGSSELLCFGLHIHARKI